MFRAGDHIAIGLSGGKDSAALLYSLRKLYPDKRFIAIHLDHGIGEYSKDSRLKAKMLADMLDVEFHVFDYREHLDIIIPDVKYTKYKDKICAVCGTLRRWGLSRAAKEVNADILATGHNLDDIVEVLFNHFINGDFEEMVRLQPVLPPQHPSQVWKVKPLFRSPERDNYLYAMLNELPIKAVSCPYYSDARSIRRKELLDEWEKHDRNIKFQLLSTFTKKLIPILSRNIDSIEYRTCKECGGPSLGEICSACRRIEMIRSIKKI